MALSSTDAALSGFSLIRRQPTAVAVWSVLAFAGSLLSVVALTAVGGQNLQGLAAAGAGPQAALTQVDWGPVGSAYVLLLIITLALMSVLYGAVCRSILSPEDDRLFYLRFGGDELRLLLLWLILFGFYLLAMLAMLLVFAIPIAALALPSGGQQPGMGQGFAVVGLILLGMLATFAVYIWLGVRLSLAAPMTFAKGRVRIREAWKLTRGSFWPLFGAYLLAFIFLMMLSLVVSVVGLSLAALASGVGLGEALIRNSTVATDMGAAFQPVRLINYAINSAFIGITYAVWFAPAVHAYAQLRPQENLAETFA